MVVNKGEEEEEEESHAAIISTLFSIRPSCIHSTLTFCHFFFDDAGTSWTGNCAVSERLQLWSFK